ncbi:hypothetical protein J437_LFUL013919 [Ladona fulva]|uniref:DDE Tnp4 domain-containing protein n=1 Tax=Ladona fulva TaxID=123851 RepID=A0A8K0KF44_LADFU|nr:hypothetical protein J437_LFUL013919 [Ladona fulva]
MGKQVLSGNIFPPDERLPDLNKVVPYVIVGDETFRLHKHGLKPYCKITARGEKSKVIFNYRLPHAHRVMENAFGVLSQIFRVFYSPIAVTPEKCELLVIAACCLHNILRNGYLEHHQQPHYLYDSSIDPPASMSVGPYTKF